MLPKFLLITLCCYGLVAQTGRYGNSRLASTSSESILTPSLVQSGRFANLGAYTISGHTYSEPIIAERQTIGGKTYDVLFQVTLSGNVYAFDANAVGSSPLWSVNITTPRSSYPGSEALQYGQAVGCMATPLVYQGYLFVECTDNTPIHTLYKLNLSTGATVASAILTASVTGTGDSTGGVADNVSGGTLTFFPDYEMSRPSLTGANGYVYVSFGSYDDVPPWHGWIMAVSVSSMAVAHAICLSPNGSGAAVWPASGPAVDASGNLYVTTGNGDYDGTSNFAESIVKLSPALTIVDWFTPSDYATMSAADKDMSAGPFLPPGTNLVVAAAKDGRIFSIDRSCMGKLGGTVGGCSPQIFGTGNAILNVAFMNGIGYFSRRTFSGADGISAYTLTGSSWNTTATTSTVTSYFPGAIVSGSSNGASNGILWATTVGANAATTAQGATLRAFNASTLAEIWNSGSTIGNMSKYTPPHVWDGKVYVATQSGQIVVRGAVASSVARGRAKVSGNTVLR